MLSNERENEMKSQQSNLPSSLSVQNYPILFYKKNGSLQEHISKISVTDEEAIQGSINTHKKLEQDNENCKEELNYLKRELEEKEKVISFMEHVLHLIRNTFMEQSSTSDCKASASLIQELEVMLEKISISLRTQENYYLSNITLLKTFQKQTVQKHALHFLALSFILVGTQEEK